MASGTNAFDVLMRRKSTSGAKRKACGGGKRELKKQKQKQLFLDLGQTDLGQRTCKKCGFLYINGVEADDKEHTRFCKGNKANVHISGWNDERVHMKKGSSRILEVRGNDAASHVKKLLQIKRMIEDALGFIEEEEFLERNHYIYLENDIVVGCACVESVNTAYPFSYDNEIVAIDKSKPMDVHVGISHIWVHSNSRRKGIAKLLLNIVRQKFMYGMTISLAHCAFSQPTKDGVLFGQNYCAPHPMLVYT
ncbi:N-acetyltransferase [Thraustotheca clavata]|uniref:N-acetyltransferase n=1 Tax=Thraustotheca clavata TaxID=74557 RepID=A0A1W0AC37_9STRA|nr:N-acetyltransferase [Thraustotheca clavata]